MLEINILSLFPSYVESPLRESILKRAIDHGYVKISSHDIRAYSTEVYHRVDDRPFGGGPGMVLMPEPVSAAIHEFKKPHSKVIYLSPQGQPLTAQLARQLAQEKHLILLAGHYEGIDQRVLEKDVDLEVSIGDVVLTNGILPALVLIDAVSRFIPGVLGHADAAAQDSFEDGLLDCPHYTKPVFFHDKEVPEVLRSGDHSRIALWKRQRQIEKTFEVRPDLFSQWIEKGKMPSIGFFSCSLDVLHKWYKKIHVCSKQNLLQGFSCTFPTCKLIFLPSSSSSMGYVHIPLDIDQWSVLQKKVQANMRDFLRLASPDQLVLQDPEGRVISFTLQAP